MSKKLRLGILCGGISVEHEVSLQSAKSIFDAIDKNKYEIVIIGIDKTGQWYFNNSSDFFLNANDPKLIRLNCSKSNLISSPRKNLGKLAESSISLAESPILKLGEPLDVIFPVLHGSFGEDGTIQGLLKIAKIPFVGANVLGSAIGMDKDVMKRLLREAGIPICNFLTFNRHSFSDTQKIFDSVVKQIGIPFFVKPANLGSSIGINLVSEREQFEDAIQEAFQYDNKLLLEEYIKGREIECSVLGNNNPISSIPGEVIPRDKFYSYEAKYIDEKGAILEIPANLNSYITEEIRQLSIKVFKVLCCSGLARVDFFLRDNGDILVNEINTIPGFTKISMYPKLWEATGISYSELIDKLIELALEIYDEESKLKRSF